MSLKPSNRMVGAAGIEPATAGLEIRCSIRLSYAPSVKLRLQFWFHSNRSSSATESSAE
jgi:hypothetical protein